MCLLQERPWKVVITLKMAELRLRTGNRQTGAWDKANSLQAKDSGCIGSVGKPLCLSRFPFLHDLNSNNGITYHRYYVEMLNSFLLVYLIKHNNRLHCDISYMHMTYFVHIQTSLIFPLFFSSPGPCPVTIGPLYTYRWPLLTPRFHV